MTSPEIEHSSRSGWFTPARIALLYAVVCIAWNLSSNLATTGIAQKSAPEYLSIPERILFVVISSATLYFLLRHIDRRLRSSRDIFNATFIDAPDAISIHRLGDLSVLKVNNRFARIFGSPQAGSNDISLQPSALWNFRGDLDLFKQHLTDFGEVNEFDTVFRTAGGSLLNVVLFARIVEQEGEACVVINIHDISRVVKAEEEAKRLAHYDNETGLPNHNLLLDRLNQIIALDSRERRCTALIYINLTGFKAIMDIVGLNGSKEVLKAIARQLSGMMRQIDTVARISREDFVVVLGGKIQESDISLILHKIQKVFEKPVDLPDGHIMLTAAFGVACFPADGLNADMLLQNAHAAMIQARNSEAGGFRFFSDSFNSKVLERRRIEISMKTGLKSGEFFLCYQPKYTASGKEIAGMEALVRWNRAGVGLMLPDQFIPIAEENGFIVELGKWILHEACRQNKKWHDAGLYQLRVSVNISVRQLHENDFVECVTMILEKSGL